MNYTKDDFLKKEIPLYHAPDNFLNDEDFIKQMIEKTPENLMYVNDSFMYDHIDLVAFSVNRCKWLTRQLPQGFRNEEYIIGELMSKLHSSYTKQVYYDIVSEEIKEKYDPMTTLIRNFEERYKSENIKG